MLRGFGAIWGFLEVGEADLVDVGETGSDVGLLDVDEINLLDSLVSTLLSCIGLVSISFPFSNDLVFLVSGVSSQSAVAYKASEGGELREDEACDGGGGGG